MSDNEIRETTTRPVEADLFRDVCELVDRVEQVKAAAAVLQARYRQLGTSLESLSVYGPGAADTSVEATMAELRRSLGTAEQALHNADRSLVHTASMAARFYPPRLRRSQTTTENTPAQREKTADSRRRSGRTH